MRQPFWRHEPLSPNEVKLFRAVLEAHRRSAYRPNVSSETVRQSAVVGGNDYCKAMASALLTLGGLHAPIPLSMRFLSEEDPVAVAKDCLDNNLRLPGWGNSFHKDGPDPEWAEVDALLKEHWPDIHAKIEAVTKVLHEDGKRVYPNPSIYTAAAAIILELPPESSFYLLVLGRLTAWTDLFTNPKK